ncbi:MAG: SpoIIE family protein phosphatase, partial [Bacteroidales bacterium]|nr:SpoIIE family protein phosphatase [Bacteroidales bacterium]
MSISTPSRHLTMASKSFSLRLSLNIIFIVALLSLATLTVVSISSHNIVVRESKLAAENMLKATIKDIEKDLREIEVATENAGWWAYANRNDARMLGHLCASLVGHNPYITSSVVAMTSYDVSKSAYVYTDPATGEIKSLPLSKDKCEYLQSQWFGEATGGLRPRWSDPYYDRGGSERMLVTYSVPVMDLEGRLVGVVTADITLEWLQQKMEAIKPYPNCTASLLNDNQHLLATTIAAASLASADSQLSAAASENERIQKLGQAIREGKDSMMDLELSNGKAFVVFGSLENRWAASISFQYEDILSEASRLYLIIALVGLFGLLVMFVLCYVSVRRLTQPITKLSDAAITMSAGNFDVALPAIKTDDEIMQLRNSFDFMQKSLKNYIAELKTTTASNERMESELNIARGIQSALLVREFPQGVSTAADGRELFHYDVHAFLEPAKAVGGDLYDCRLKDNILYFAVGDVSGKGVPAALVMGITRASLRFINGLGITMSDVAGRVNNIVAEGNETGMFVTLFCGRIDLTTGECSYCNAGHNPIVVKPAGGEARFLRAKSNIAVGLFPDFPYVGEEMQLSPGDTLLFYTDGVSEAERADKSLFGDDRLLAWANTSQAFASGTSQEAVEDLYATVKAFTEGHEANDDITIMVIR